MNESRCVPTGATKPSTSSEPASFTNLSTAFSIVHNRDRGFASRQVGAGIAKPCRARRGWGQRWRSPRRLDARDPRPRAPSAPRITAARVAGTPARDVVAAAVVAALDRGEHGLASSRAWVFTGAGTRTQVSSPAARGTVGQWNHPCRVMVAITWHR